MEALKRVHIGMIKTNLTNALVMQLAPPKKRD